MSVRTDALIWLNTNFKSDNKVYTSKYYSAEESWPKIPVWWFKIPQNAIDEKSYKFVNLICQVAPSVNKFYYLKVPVAFFKKHFEKFHQTNNQISIYLSAAPEDLFTERRGEGALDFSMFIVK